MDDAYHTIARPARAETKVKGSRFIAECDTVAIADDAMAYLNAIRKREHAATHHCSAWTVGLFEEMQFKYSDDGEPTGTAGRPIYDQIVGHGVANCVVVVTRYFGGTKLGTGGLARAYSEAAGLALDRAGQAEHFLTSVLTVDLDFSLYDLLAKTINRLGARQLDARFTDRVEVDIEIRRSRVEELHNEIVQLSGGKAKIERA